MTCRQAVPSPRSAVFTALMALSRGMGIGSDIRQRLLDAHIALGTLAAAYLWLVHETGSLIPALPTDLTVVLVLFLFAATLLLLTTWAAEADERYLHLSANRHLRKKYAAIFWMGVALAIGATTVVLLLWG